MFAICASGRAGTVTNVIALGSGAGLANATLQLRVKVVRLLNEFLVEERVRDRNPVGRGYRTADGRAGRRGLVSRYEPLPWIPTDAQWRAVLAVAAGGSLRNRLMLALAYDAALRREELCLLASDDLDPANRRSDPGGDDEKPSFTGGPVFSGRRSVPGRVPRAPSVDHLGPWRVVRLGVAAQPGGGDIGVDVVEGGAVDRRAGGGAGVQHAHAAAPVPDRSRTVRLGASRIATFAGHRKHRHDASVRPPLGRDLADRVGERDDADSCAADRAVAEALS